MFDSDEKKLLREAELKIEELVYERDCSAEKVGWMNAEINEKTELLEAKVAELSETREAFEDFKLTAIGDKSKIAEVEAELRINKSNVKHLEKALEQYKTLPDLNNMIKNIQNLNAPAIDKLVEVMEKSSGDDNSGLAEEVASRVEGVVHNSCQRMVSEVMARGRDPRYGY